MKVKDAIELYLDEQTAHDGLHPEGIPAAEILRLLDFAKWCDQYGIKVKGSRKVTQVIGKVEQGATVVGMKL